MLTLDELAEALVKLRSAHPELKDQLVFSLSGSWIELDAHEVDLEGYVTR